MNLRFTEVSKTLKMPNGGVKQVIDYQLTRYACYLIIDKAMLACENSGHNVDDHFAEVGKMIEIGKGGKRNTGI